LAKFLKIVEWDSFQHYKDRNPQWIKLHTSILSSPVWWRADDSQKALIIVVMLMAARHGNNIPADPRFIQQIGYLKAKPNLNWLVKQGFCVYSDIEERRESPWPSRYIPDEIRQQVLTRDNNQCVKCKSPEKLEIDHIIPVSKGGKGVIDNLQTLCISCNRSKRNRVASRYADATQTENQRSLEKSREENINPEREELEPSDEIGIDAATQKVFLEVGLAGNEARMLCHDSVKAFVHQRKCSFAEAADSLIELWGKYSALDIPYKKGVFKFFKEGLWGSPDVWVSGSKKDVYAEFLAKGATQ